MPQTSKHQLQEVQDSRRTEKLHQQQGCACSYLLPLHDDRLRQRVVAPLLVGESLQVIELRLQLEDEIFLLLPLSLQTLPLLPFILEDSHKRTLEHQHADVSS